MKRIFRDFYIITIVFILASAVLYGYYEYFGKDKTIPIYRNWDGPAYVIVAKTLYNINLIHQVNTVGLMPADYSQQFPLYPLFIRMFSFLGYKQSMIFTSQFFSLLFIFTFYLLLRIVNPKANTLMISLLLIFYTPRWFIVSHVGSSEPIFMFFATLFLLLFMKNHFFLAALSASLAQASRAQGILYSIGVLVYSFGDLFITRKTSIIKGIKKYLPFVLIPLTLAGIFTFFWYSYGDFFINIKIHAGHPEIRWLPLQMFINYSAYEFNAWKESLIINYIIYLLAIIIMFQKRLYFIAVTSLVFYIPLLFLFHVDVSRYALPLLPVLFLAFSDSLSKKSVYITLLACIPLVYLFAIGYININLAGPLPFNVNIQ